MFNAFGSLSLGDKGDLPYTDDPFSEGKAASNGGAVTTGQSNDSDIVRTTTTAADTRNAGELQARIKAAGGALRTNANSSDYIVAVNNRLKFSVTQLSNGQYEIRETQYYWLLIGAAALVGLAVVAKNK